MKTTFPAVNWYDNRIESVCLSRHFLMETRKKVLGQKHPNTLTNMANLASTYRNQGRWKEAEDLFVLAMETRKRVLGQEHPSTLTSMANLAFTWKEQGQDEGAPNLLKECIILRTKTIVTNHPDTLSSCATLLEWQTKELEISALADKDSGV